MKEINKSKKKCCKIDISMICRAGLVCNLPEKYDLPRSVSEYAIYISPVLADNLKR